MNKIQRIINKLKNGPEIDKKSAIGKYSYIGNGSIVCDSVIGKYCSIGTNVLIGQSNHYLHSVSMHPFINQKRWGFIKEDYYPDFYKQEERPRPKIGNDVWIASDSIILRGG